jgi:hypothetical protein
VKTPRDDGPVRVQSFEPKVPFGWVSWAEFGAGEPYDVVCLARSPSFTPPASDELFDEIRDRFIDETAFETGARRGHPGVGLGGCSPARPES